MANHIGHRLGNYRLISKIGKGGFAEVYLGEHMRLYTQAAVKVLQTRLAGDEAESFYLEARTVARLVHPHIVRVLDFDVEDGLAFLVMDYAANGTLRQHYSRGTQLPLAAMLQYVLPVAAALQYAHDEKVIHRDVKPENIFLGRRGEVLLGDFGIATVAQNSRFSSRQDVAGTLSYMAPEQIQAQPLAASDQYALAVVVYELLCGDRPFHGSMPELAAKHTSVAPPPLRSHIASLPSAVEQVVLKALSKDPGERFSSVQAFAEALEQACMPHLQSARPSSIATATTLVAPKQSMPVTTPAGVPTISPATFIDFKLPQRTFAAFERQIALTPRDVTLYYQRAIAYRDIKEYRLAIADFNSAIELDTNGQGPTGQVAALHYYQRGLTYLNLKDYLRAIDDFDRALFLDPQLSVAYYSRGLAYLSLEKYARAANSFTHAIALDPRLASAYYQRGKAYYHLGDFRQAIDNYNRSLALEPGEAIGYFHRGLAYSELKEHAQAIADFDHALALDPRQTSAYNNRGLTSLELQDYTRAIDDFSQAIAMRPDYATAYNNRGLAYYECQDYEQALADFDTALALDPVMVSAYYNRGKAHFDLQNYEQALLDFDAAGELNDDDPLIYYHRGLTLIELKAYEPAIADFDTVIRLDPTDVDAWYNRGLAYLDLKDYARAIQDFDEALRLNPEYGSIYLNRGLAYFNLKHYQQAIADFDYALYLNPGDSVAYNHREQAYKKLHSRIRL